ncbi:protoporphyrinogen oxidase [Metabacillus arenae]|uniref:Coproporphyrinogen III oxidase n=1 Tax=Metabacillus arenae TaxID=2771434 RepID=A0A926NG67_9BACI|nr:protoporphyrinogen oxidase [Metabacillus arenae]MBD1380696.1 protoporphyrinogen oxidase [Metabacillus arenae]
MRKRNQHVTIIGGGLTGLSAAYYLKREIQNQQLEVELSLIEASPRLGGKIQTVRRNGFTIERGPDSFLERKESAPQLVKDLGLESKLVNNATGKSYVLANDKLHPMPEGAVMGIPTQIMPFVTTGLFSVGGKARAAADFLLPAKNINGDQSLGQFFRRRLGDQVVENLIEPLLSGIYAGDIDQLSLMSTFPQFYKVEQEHRSLILGLKKSTPKSNQTYKAERKKGIFQTVQGGLQTIIEAFEENLSDINLLKGTKVLDIKKSDDKYEITLSNGDKMESDSIILAAPHTVVPAILKDHALFDYFKAMPSTSVATVAMAFPKNAVRMDQEGTGFVISRNSDYTITACTWTHKKWPHTTPDDQVMLRAYVGKPGDQAIVDQPDDVIIKTVMDDLKRIISIDVDSPNFAYVTRWKQAMPQYHVGHKEKIKRIKDRMKDVYPGIFLSGASYEGIGLPDCIDQGKTAVQHVLQFLSEETNRVIS